MIATVYAAAGQLAALGGALRAEEGGHGTEFHAENSWLPPTDELIWATLTFGIVLALLIWKGWPQAKKMAADRTARIAAEIAAAEHARADAERTAATVVAQLADVDGETSRILAEARTAADALRNEQTARLQVELADLRTRALDDIESSKVRAVQELHSTAAVLAVGAAEQIVRRSLDAATQQALVDQFISQLDRTAATA